MNIPDEKLDENQTVLCECMSFSCPEKIVMSMRDFLSARQLCIRSVIISNRCLVGPESTDIKMEEKENYTIWREG